MKMSGNNEQPIRHFNLAHLENLDSSKRCKFRVTGRVVIDKEDLDQLELINDEYANFKIKVDLSCLNNFEPSDIHAQHDLVQFIGYLDRSESKDHELKLKAIFSRVLKRTNLKDFNKALNIQTEYLNKRLNLF